MYTKVLVYLCDIPNGLANDFNFSDDLTWATYVFLYWLVFSGIHNCALAFPPEQTGFALNLVQNTHFLEKLI